MSWILQISFRCCKFRNFVSLLQLCIVNTLANQDKEQPRKQAEEDSDGSQEEWGAMLDGEMEGGTAGDSLMEGKLLQSVQYLDPHQIHHHHCQQTQASQKQEIIVNVTSQVQDSVQICYIISKWFYHRIYYEMFPCSFLH